MGQGSPDDAEELRDEARRYGRYLIGCDPGPELTERYVRAHGTLFTEPPSLRDSAVIGFCHRHPRSLPYLDAVAGLLAPESLLRRKLLVLSAVLETTPGFADHYLPATRSTALLIFELTVLGACAVLRFLVGLALWPVARRHG